MSYQIRSRHSVTCLTFVALLGTFALTAEASAQTVNACVSKSTGDARILIPGLSPQNATCSSKEVAMSWSVEGPAGPPAPPPPGSEVLAFFSLGGSEGKDVYLTGANLHVVNGLGDTASKNAYGNVIVGYNEEFLFPNDTSGSHMLVLGRANSYSSWGGLVAGAINWVNGPYSSVLGGSGNLASGEFSTVTGGNQNVASGLNSTVAGGQVVRAETPYGWAAGPIRAEPTRVRVTGANLHVENGLHATSTKNSLGNVIIGYNEPHPAGEKTGSHTLVVGSHHSYSSWGGLVAGRANYVDAEYASVLGGEWNAALGLGATVCGGTLNQASGYVSSAGGGFDNRASGPHSSVSGGAEVTASAESSWAAATFRSP
jgi:hypothetical protein